ncbi:MAG TPA: HAD family phosphatase [Chlamydiales bacterium]|nr:HAD family phosphatase [Chlamydiales bacterium]
MKKLLYTFLAMGTLAAAPQAVVFDWGDVLATHDRAVIIQFMCETLHLSEADFEKANLKKRKAIEAGQSDVDFWLQFAKEKGIVLGKQWPESYEAILKKSVGADEEMASLVHELKEKEISVGLLSNINGRYAKIIRDLGFYDPFEPCLLSYDMGLEKPDPRVYQLLLEKLNLPAGEVVFIDDKEENVEAAKKLGIDGVVFQSAEQVRQALIDRELL